MSPVLQWRQMATGLFFLGFVVVLLSGLLIVGTNQNLFYRTYTIRTYLPDTQTLAEGTGVTLSGIEIGTIEKITLATREGQHVVEFRLRLKKAYQDRITTSSTASVRSIGVLGDKYLEIRLGEHGEPPLPEGAVIPCTPAVDWEKVLGEVSDSIIDVLHQTQGILHDVEAGRGTIGALVHDSTLVVRLVGTLERTENTLAALEQKRGTLGRLIYDPKLYDELAATTARLEAVARKVDAGEGSLGRLVNDRALYDHAASAAAGLDTTVARINAGRGTVGQALNDDQAYQELHKAIVDLRTLLQDLQANPRRYLKFSVF